MLDFVSPGFVLPKGSEGGSWKSILLNHGSGKVTRPVDRFVWHHATEVEHPQSAIRKGDFKLLYYWDTREAQLFNVAHDPGEARNLAAEKPELAKELLNELRAHLCAGLGEKARTTLESGVFPPPRGKKEAGENRSGGKLDFRRLF